MDFDDFFSILNVVTRVLQIPEFRLASSKIEIVSSMRNTRMMNCLSSSFGILDTSLARNLNT